MVLIFLFEKKLSIKKRRLLLTGNNRKSSFNQASHAKDTQNSSRQAKGCQTDLSLPTIKCYECSRQTRSPPHVNEPLSINRQVLDKQILQTGNNFRLSRRNSPS